MSGNFSHISRRFSEPVDPVEIAVALCNALFPTARTIGTAFPPAAFPAIGDARCPISIAPP